MSGRGVGSTDVPVELYLFTVPAGCYCAPTLEPSELLTIDPRDWIRDPSAELLLPTDSISTVLN